MVGIISAVLTLLVILFAEIIPKTIGESRHAQVSLLTAPVVLFLTKLFLPGIWITEKITKPISNLLGTHSAITSEEEILALAELGRKTGVIDERENDLIQRIFELNDVTAWDIMTPLARVDALDMNRTLVEVKDDVMNFTHTRIPVYEGSLNQIMGVVHVGDLLKAMAEDKMNIKVGSLAKEASFIPDSNRGSDLLHHFKQSKQHLVIVMNAFDTVLGVLSLEDVLEELVGDIVDETDVEQEDIQVISNIELLASAEADTIDVADHLGVEIPEMRLGEFVLEQFGRIPKVGETVRFSKLELIIEEGTPRMIQAVRIKKCEPSSETDSKEDE
jgi:CBS domain containing-hemolysin-like protein